MNAAIDTVTPALPPEEPLLDLPAVRDWSRFALHAVQRHAAVAGSIFVLLFGGALSVPYLLGRTWHVEATLLAQRNQVMPALGNPNRAVPRDADAPTRAAAEIVLRRANLISLIQQTKLMEGWDESRAPLRRLNDRLRDLVFGPRDDDEKLDAMVGMLERRLMVRADEGTVTISIDWPNPQAAHRLVDTAQQNFLEARHVSEVSTIVEAISILEGHAAEVRQNILTSIAEVEKLQPKSPRSAPAPRVSSAPDEKRAQLLVLLNAKRRAIADLEEFRRRRLGELQAQITQQRASYQEIHPVIVDLKETIEALQKESPQIETLRKEERQIAAEYSAAGGRLPPDDAGERLAQAAPAEALALAQRPSDYEDPAHEYARAGLRFAVSKYESLLDRIDGARIELDTARAAFKYRYSVVRPSQVPKKPSRPKMKLLIAGGLMGGLFFSLCAAVALDLLSGKALEPWQLQRMLHVPLIGRLEGP